MKNRENIFIIYPKDEHINAYQKELDLFIQNLNNHRLIIKMD